MATVTTTIIIITTIPHIMLNTLNTKSTPCKGITSSDLSGYFKNDRKNFERFRTEQIDIPVPIHTLAFLPIPERGVQTFNALIKNICNDSKKRCFGFINV